MELVVNVPQDGISVQITFVTQLMIYVELGLKMVLARHVIKDM